MQPSQSRRAERARRAKDTVVRIIPDILRANPRARHGIHRADLIVDPSPRDHIAAETTTYVNSAHPRIRIQCADTLTAAGRMSERPFVTRRPSPHAPPKETRRPNVAVLNMASSLRPGGGFLDGANSQEEFLCARTTLYASLWDSFYRLPEVGGIFTPDVMVFRDHTPEANELSKRDRFFIDVISAGMMRFPDSKRARHEEGVDSPPCSCGVSYCDRDRDLVIRKMKAVLRMAEQHGVQRLVLGAWGCGAYGNPVLEVAKLWRKVIAGGPRQRRPNTERWTGIRDITFAIPDRNMAREFESAFGDVLSYDAPSPVMDFDDLDGISQTSLRASLTKATEDQQIAALISKIAETEMEMEQSNNTRTQARIREVLGDLNRELTRGLAARQFSGDDYTLAQDEDIESDISPTGMSSLDHEGNSFFNFDENDVASDSSESNASGIYDFRASTRPRRTSFASQMSHDAETLELQDLYAVLPPSPSFDAETGWYTGSIDQFHKLVRDAEAKVNGDESPRSLMLDETEDDHRGPESDQLRHYLDQHVDSQLGSMAVEHV